MNICRITAGEYIGAELLKREKPRNKKIKSDHTVRRR